LPPRITSTLGGTDYYLSEIRNVVSTSEDIAKLWDCAPEQIKILGIDLGQAFVVGASALLPSREPPGKPQGRELDSTSTEFLLSHVEGAVEDLMAKKPPTRFYNLAVKQKAVYQPTLKHRRWLEQRK
ncbi:hypothetical protein BGX33_004499, partial [Mortierella sp. NVP41]